MGRWLIENWWDALKEKTIWGRKECLFNRKLIFGIAVGFLKDTEGILGMVTSDSEPGTGILVMQG